MSNNEQIEHTNMKSTSWLAFSVDRKSSTPVFEQICDVIREAAISGELSEGDRLPATRVFATELGLSRSTIVTAYEQLVAEGYLQSRQGAGYTICALGEVELQRKPAPKAPVAPPETSSAPRPFQASQPDMRLFPHRQWAKAVARVCRSNPEVMLNNGDIAGNPALRQAISDHVRDWRGIDAAPDQIFITAGSTDGLEICLRALTRPGDAIGLEDPGYMPLRRFAEAHGLTPVWMPVDADGAQLPAHPPKAVVLTPSHQYPLGGAMSPGRRMEFINAARAQDSWIIEDDYDSEFRYAGRPIPALSGFDQLNRSVYIGSFSKIFSNNLRLGYVIVPDHQVRHFRDIIGQFGLKASSLPQQALAEFMLSGEFYRHLRRMRRIYGERRKYLLDRLRTDFADLGHCVDHQAGMQILLRLGINRDDKAITDHAAARGLTLQALSDFSQNGTEKGLLFGFCGYSEEEIAAALEQLRLCIA